jgi:hypothetical protein
MLYLIIDIFNIYKSTKYGRLIEVNKAVYSTGGENTRPIFY